MARNDAHGNRRRSGRATIEDVAAAAGVSVATVSRALRGLPNVALSTREKVREIADELSYRADPAASRLATGRSRAIGVAVPVLNSWYFSNVVAGAEAVCTDAGYDLVVLGVTSAEHRDRLLRDTDGIHRRIDGLILVDVLYPDDDLRSFAARELPTVMVGPKSAAVPSVGIDDVEVGRIATMHLVELGHTRIAVIEGQAEDPFDFVVPHRRFEGYADVLADAGMSIDPDLRASGNFSITGGHEAVSALLQLDEPPTAVFAMSDEMAFGALQAAFEHGVAVPDELSVIGVDDHEFATVVGLTTVHQDVADHGAHAARMLLARLDGTEHAARRVDAPVRLVDRRTTAPPPRS